MKILSANKRESARIKDKLSSKSMFHPKNLAIRVLSRLFAGNFSYSNFEKSIFGTELLTGCEKML